MKTKKIIFSLFLTLILIGLACFLFVSFQQAYGKKIISNIWLGDYYLKGLTREEARILIEEKIAHFETNGIIFKTEDKNVVIYPIIVALADPDLTRQVISFDVDQTIENIFLLPQKSDLLKIFKNTDKKNIEVIIEINEEEILKMLKSSFDEFKKPTQDASLKYEDGFWKISEEMEGQRLNFEKAILELKENLAQLDLNSIFIKTINVKPTIYKQDIETTLEEVEKISQLTPINLFHNKEKWTINKEIIISWIDFKKETQTVFVDLNKEKIKEHLIKISEKIDQPAQEAKFKLENERVTEFQLAREGKKLDITKNTDKIKKYILANVKEIELEVLLEKPTVLVRDINDLGISELVGRGESDFRGSPKNRVTNIEIGSKILNGLLIKPGEEFSLLRAQGPITKEAGYLPELVIKGGRTVPELGGGLCQIATTVFRVALDAGVPITQRTPHAFRVIYYEPAGIDATIYNPSPDFRFVNDFDSWLLLQVKIEGTKLIFELYGTNDGRKVEIDQPKIFNIVSPGPAKYIETEELKPGERKKVENAVAGANTEFVRTITYSDGEKKEELWESRYRPWPEVWLIGKQPVTQIETQSETTH